MSGSDQPRSWRTGQFISTRRARRRRIAIVGGFGAIFVLLLSAFTSISLPVIGRVYLGSILSWIGVPGAGQISPGIYPEIMEITSLIVSGVSTKLAGGIAGVTMVALTILYRRR